MEKKNLNKNIKYFKIFKTVEETDFLHRLIKLKIFLH